MSAFLFLDESGDHGLRHVDPNYPLFLLCGCLFSEESLEKFQSEIDAFKIKYWNTINVILHSRDIRRCEGPFHILFDLTLKRAFYEDLNAIMRRGEFTVISAAIDKEAHAKKYGTLAHDPYDMSLSFIMERLIYCQDSFPKYASVKLVLEKRGAVEDVAMAAHFNRIRDRGTFYVTPERMSRGVIGCEFMAKKENHVGLQCADLCAYPLGRSMVLKGEPSPAADIVRQKIYSRDGKQYGLKIFP